MGVIVNHGLPPGVSAGGEGAGDPPAAARGARAASRTRSSRRSSPRRCVSVAVWVIAVIWVKEQPLRRSLDEVAAVEAAAGDAAGGGRSRIPLVTEDFMPLDGWDHVELWVGQREAGGVLLRARVRLPPHRVRGAGDRRARSRELRARAERDPPRRHERAAPRPRDRRLRVQARRRRQGHRAARAGRERGATRQAVQRGARGVIEPQTVEDEFGSVELATIATYGDVVHTFVDRRDYEGAYLPGLRRAGVGERRRRRCRPARDRPRRRQRRARPHEALGRVLRAGLRDDRDDPLQRRRHLDRVLGADVEGDDGRPGQDQVPDQRAGRGQAQEPDRRVPRVQPRPRRAAHRAAVVAHRRDRRGAAASAASSS